MSITDKLSQSIEHGLQIAEYVQENREAIQKAIGRSSIRDPDGSESISKWKALVQKAVSANDRLKGNQASEDGKREGGGSENKSISNEQCRKLSSTEDTVDESIDSGDYGDRYDPDTLVSSRESEESDGNGLGQTDRGWCVVTTRNDESEESNQDNKSNDGTDAEPGRGSEQRSVDGGDHAVPRVLSVKETTQEDLEKIMEESLPSPTKRIKNINIAEEIKNDLKMIPSVVKKTTDRNSASMKLKVKSESDDGATLSAGESSSNPDLSPVDAESVLSGATSAEMIQRQDLSEGQVTLQQIKSIEEKLNEVLDNQKKIIEMGSSINVIKEEIQGIKKILTNHSLALSTLDGYIGELMIVIPKSGKSDTQASKEINPDLRLVIGRDNSRGRSEVIKKYDPSERIEIGEDLYMIPEMDYTHVIDDIDNTKNNAANFVPTDDYISEEIIKNIVGTEVDDPALVKQIFEMIDDSLGKIPMKEIYTSIRALLDSMHMADYERSHNK